MKFLKIYEVKEIVKISQTPKGLQNLKKVCELEKCNELKITLMI